MNTSENICQDLAATGLKSYIFLSRLGTPSLEMLHFCSSMSPSLDNDCTLQDLAFQVLKLFAGNSLVMDLSKNWIIYVFHDWVFQDMNTSENICQDLAATGLEMLHFCNSMSPSLDNDCILQDLDSQVLKLFAGNSLIMFVQTVLVILVCRFQDLARI